MSETIAIAGGDVAADQSLDHEIEQPQSLVDWKSIWKPLGIIAGVFLMFFWLPINI